MELQDFQFKYILTDNTFDYNKYPLLYVLKYASDNISKNNYSCYLKTLKFYGYNPNKLDIIEKYKDCNVSM